MSLCHTLLLNGWEQGCNSTKDIQTDQFGPYTKRKYLKYGLCFGYFCHIRAYISTFATVEAPGPIFHNFNLEKKAQPVCLDVPCFLQI